MDAINPSRRKRSHAKVRTGCQTCKSRRLKCSEERPKCLRCQKSGLHCTYAVPKTWLFEPQRVKVHNGLRLLPSGKSPSSCDQRAFEFFKANTAAQFAGQLDHGQKFWNVYILRSAMHDPIVFKLVAAMGARHEASLMGSSEADAVATKNHELAISSLARDLPNMRVDLSLLSCGLLSAYANLCEEVPATAAIHFSLGLKIIRELTKSGRGDTINNELCSFVVPMFTELEMIAAIFVPYANAEMICPLPLIRPSVPDAFNDLYHAKNILGDLLRWLIRVQSANCMSMIDLSARISEANELLSRWRRALTAYSLTIAASFPGLYLKARKMLFQYKLFDMVRGAAQNPVFLDACHIRVVSIDLSRPHITSVVCALVKDESFDNTWRPLHTQHLPRHDIDDLDIWPRGESVGHDGSNEMTRITLGG